MSALTVDISARLAEHHRLASDQYLTAKELYEAAVEHARLAGVLLLEVKAKLEHGQFLPWLEQHVLFTARTAQRYMAIAAPTPKNDRLSHTPSKPKAGTKRAKQIEQMNVVRHREDVLSHASYLVAELPITQALRPDDLHQLAVLRDRINVMLENSHG